MILLEPYLYPIKQSQRHNAEDAKDLAIEAKLLERMPSAELITVNDPRLGRLLRIIVPDAQNALDAAKALLDGSHAPTDMLAVTDNIRKLREQTEALSQLKLEDELMSLIFNARSQRNAEIFIRRFGLDGNRKKLYRN